MSNCKYKDRFLSCAVLCGLLFFTYRQEMVLPEGAVQTEQTEQTEETREAEKMAEAVREEKVTDAAEEAEEEEKAEKAGDNEALELLIEDTGFQECVYDAVDIKKKDSKEEVLRKLERCESLTLEEGSCNIYSLEALSLFPNVRQLTIYIDKWDDSVIADFTPVSGLPRLEYLWISYEKDEEIDLSFLEQMPQLKSLFLYQMPVEDLAILKNLPDLVELAVSGNENTKNMETVGKLTKLRDLEMQNCGIRDISFLDGLTELRSVKLKGNRITDITPLSSLYKLERVELSENKIKDLSALSGLHNIIRLEINKNEIHDISPLAQLFRLNQVEIADNQVEDLSPLAGKEELLYAVVYGNPVKSLKPVWEAPLLWYTYECAGDEGQAVIADWLVEHYPEAAEFTCIDFVEGDLNGDGLQDRAFVADSEAFDVYEGEGFPAVRESLPYVGWQKERYERLVGVTLPDYYYILLETEGEEEWGTLYYEGLMEKEGILCHVVGMGSKTGGDVFWVNDATGEITAKVPLDEKNEIM